MTSSRARLYDTDIDLSSRNNSHTLMAEAAVGRARVLDLGCATGALGRVVKQAGSFVVGVELDAEAADVARTALNEVIVGDIEDEAFFERFPDATFDAVLFGDVLEHLRQPATVLARVRRLLGPDGVVITSIPNIAHAAVRLALLSGSFDYSPTGLLDETHIRFFTRASVKALFQQAGFVVLNVERTVLGAFDTEIEIEREAFPPELVAAIQSLPEAETYQFIVTATSAEAGTVARPDGDLWGASADWKPERLVQTLTRDEPRMDAALVQAVAQLGTLITLPTETATSEIPPYHFGPDANQDPHAYQLWLKNQRTARLEERQGHREALLGRTDLPTISVLVPVYRPDKALLVRCVESVRRQDVPCWQLCLCDDGSDDPELSAFLHRLAEEDDRIRVTATATNQGISAATNSAAALARSEFVAFLDQDDEIEPGALADVVAALVADTEIDVLYTDEDKLTQDGIRVEPFFKPDWSPDQLLSHMYLGHLLVVRRSLFETSGVSVRHSMAARTMTSPFGPPRVPARCCICRQWRTTGGRRLIRPPWTTGSSQVPTMRPARPSWTPWPGGRSQGP